MAINSPFKKLEISVELEKLVMCIPECMVDEANPNVPMISCGLCDGWFHMRCLGLSDGDGPPCIRGLYFCPTCLKDLREMRLVGKTRRAKEARMEAMEALVSAMDVELALLREILRRWSSGSRFEEKEEVAVRVEGRVVNATYAALLRESARLKRDLVGVITSRAVQAGRKVSIKSKQVKVSRQPVIEVSVEKEIVEPSSRKSPLPESCAKMFPRSKKFSCHVCPHVFLTWVALQNHLKIVHCLKTIYICAVCQKQFKFLRDVNKHRHLQHNGEGSTSKRFVHTEPDPVEESLVEGNKTEGSSNRGLGAVAQGRGSRVTSDILASKLIKTRCPICHDTFKSKGFLHRHMFSKHREHYKTSESPHVCLDCGTRFAKYTELKDHQRLCRRKTKSESTALDIPLVYRKSKLEEKFSKYTCHICNFRSTYGTALKCHFKIKHDLKQIYTCSLCKEQFEDFRESCKHRRSKHGASGRSYKSYIPVAKSIRRKVPVSDVGSSESSSSSEDGHGSGDANSSGNEGMKRFSCPLCRERFHGKDILLHHLEQMHHEAKRCTNIPDKTNRSLQLTTNKNIPGHAVATPITQAGGDAESRNEQTLNNSNGREWQECTVCHIKFNNLSNLKKHSILSHGLDVKISCPLCKESSFVALRDLCAHQFSQHDGLFGYSHHLVTADKPVQCPHCCKRFPTTSDLIGHTTLVHGTNLSGDDSSSMETDDHVHVPSDSRDCDPSGGDM